MRYENPEDSPAWESYRDETYGPTARIILDRLKTAKTDLDRVKALVFFASWVRSALPVTAQNFCGSVSTYYDALAYITKVVQNPTGEAESVIASLSRELASWEAYRTTDVSH